MGIFELLPPLSNDQIIELHSKIKNVCLIFKTNSGGCFDNGKDYIGNDIQMIQMPNETRCQETCQENIECNFFTFKPSNQNCWLKHAKSNPNTNNDRISGPVCC